MNIEREYYPENNNSLYYIEFSKWDGQRKMWQLFKRQYLPYQNPFTGKVFTEVHPWNLGEGYVEENGNVMSMNTKEFLKFMVDALNEKAAV